MVLTGFFNIFFSQVNMDIGFIEVDTLNFIDRDQGFLT